MLSVGSDSHDGWESDALLSGDIRVSNANLINKDILTLFRFDSGRIRLKLTKIHKLP
jgi:hypothetical protein